MLNRPIKFEPYLKTVIWGGNKIAKYTGTDTELECIGESWELSAVKGHESVADAIFPNDPLKGKKLNELISEYGAEILGTEVYKKYGNEFPLLIKLIDAHQDLSIQVHPDDKLAQERHNSLGKTEMWYIIDSDPGAKIYCGLSQALTPEEYERRIQDNTIMEVIKSYQSAPDQFYFIPAGTIHAIGAGNLLAEVQQSSDITYRVYDYDRRDANGNPRELHTELAKDAIDYTFPAEADPVTPFNHETTPNIVNCPYFNIDFLHLTGTEFKVDNGGKTFAILMVTEGEAEILNSKDEQFKCEKGETILLPATMKDFTVKGNCKCLLVTIP